VANITSLSNSLRTELGDLGKVFLQTFVSDGVTKRYQLDYYTIAGSTLIVKAGSTDISSTVSIEEHTGLLILATAPAANTNIVVSGTFYRYFTDAEIQNYVNMAFMQHANSETNAYGSRIVMSNLPAVEEYPVVLLASTLALYTLATDASYDIDIHTPDGVSIPRSERYRQLMDMVQARKEQYRELCNLLNIGMHRIEVATLRRTSNRTNRYVPIYKPQELDDGGRPQRARIPIPNYMEQSTDTVPTYDINLYRGDSFELDLDFPFSLADYTFLSQIRAFSGASLVLATFNIAITSIPNGTATLTLTSDQTAELPSRALWDVQVVKQATRPLNTTAATAVKPGYKGTVAKTGYVTYKTASAHGFVTGEKVTIANVAVLDSNGVKTLKNAYNGEFVITVFDTTSFYVDNTYTATPADTDGYNITDPDTGIVLSTIGAATATYTDPDYSKTYLHGAVIVQDQVSDYNNEPHSTGWQ
jgi:hypothetical protein